MTDIIPPKDLDFRPMEPWPTHRVPAGVRVTHRPTGIVVECDATNSQIKNLEICKDAILGALTGGHLR